MLLTAVRPGRPDFCYLVDFGIARSVTASTRSRLTATGAAVGTLDYMAPERFLAGPVDHRVDVYSLACVLYLTGCRPFPGDELAVLLNSHLNLPPPRPTEHCPGLPAGGSTRSSRPGWPRLLTTGTPPPVTPPPVTSPP